MCRITCLREPVCFDPIASGGAAVLTDAADEILSDDAGESGLSSMVQLPVPELGNLAEIEMMIRQSSGTVQGRDALARYIITEEWVAKLVPVLEVAEDLESLENLHRLCNIMKMVILLNDTVIMESIVSDEMVIGVVGILECKCPGGRRVVKAAGSPANAWYFVLQMIQTSRAIRRTIGSFCQTSQSSRRWCRFGMLRFSARFITPTGYNT